MKRKLGLLGLGLGIAVMGITNIAFAAPASAKVTPEARKLSRCNVAYWQFKNAGFWYGGGRAGNAKLQRTSDRLNNLNCTPRDSIKDVLKDNKGFSSLNAAIDVAGLGGTLDGPGNFTLFAPTNRAFAKLPSDVVNGLLNDPAQKDALTNILLYHAVGARVPASTAVTLTSATMVNGQNVTIKLQGGALFINDSKVTVTDIRTTNGIIHVIDTVLLPPTS